MSPYFAQHAGTAILFGVTVAAWVVLESRQSVRHRADAARRDRGSYYVLVLCVAAGWVTTAFSVKVPGAAIQAEPAAFVAGLALAWTGIALRGWAFHALGIYFTFRVQTSADQPVISAGPYGVLRHPGYTGIALILIGLSLLYGTWIGLVAMLVIPTAGLVNRIHIEEQALDADLGPAYRAYAAGRKRLIPHVW
jgi:protein-S-isoprenylcysteine O-methyltransferase Ste14